MVNDSIYCLLKNASYFEYIFSNFDMNHDITIMIRISDYINLFKAPSAWDVEYTDCISIEG